HLRRGQAARPPVGPDAGPEEGLVRVDVADARQAALVEQDRLYRRPPPGQRRPQMPAGEAPAQGLGPQGRQPRHLTFVAVGDPAEGGKPPGIDQEELPTFGKGDPQPQMGVFGPLTPRLLPKEAAAHPKVEEDRKSTRLNSSHVKISYAVFCLKKKNKHKTRRIILGKRPEHT